MDSASAQPWGVHESTPLQYMYFHRSAVSQLQLVRRSPGIDNIDRAIGQLTFLSAFRVSGRHSEIVEFLLTEESRVAFAQQDTTHQSLESPRTMSELLEAPQAPAGVQKMSRTQKDLLAGMLRE